MHTLKGVIAILVVGLLFAGCDNFLTDESEEDHQHTLSEIHRLALVMNGSEIVVIEENELSGGDPGEIVVEAGSESPLITLEATDDHGNEIHLDELEDHYSLSYNASKLDGDVAAFEQHEDERWSFHVHGRSAGSTQLELQFMHDDHADFKTPDIPVTIRASDE